MDADPHHGLEHSYTIPDSAYRGQGSRATRQWPARTAAALLFVQSTVLTGSAICAWWAIRRAPDVVAAAVARSPAHAEAAEEARTILVVPAQGVIAYAVVMVPLFVAGAIWLVRARTMSSRITTLVVSAVACVCCVCEGCSVDFLTHSAAGDQLLESAPPMHSTFGPIGESMVGLLSGGWLLTPLVAMAAAILLCVQLSLDRRRQPGEPDGDPGSARPGPEDTVITGG